MIQNLIAGVFCVRCSRGRVWKHALWSKHKPWENGDEYELQLWSFANRKMCWLAQTGWRSVPWKESRLGRETGCKKRRGLNRPIASSTLREIVWTHIATSKAQRWFCSIVLEKQRIQTESKRCITGVYLAILTRQMDWRAPENIWRSFYNWT